MEIACWLPVPRSFAETWMMPFESISNVTSIWGMPRGAGGIPVSWNLPSVKLSFASARSPWPTWISTLVCPSAAVEKIWLFLVGIVVLRSISFVAIPPRVSIPSVSGVTSRRTISLVSPVSTAPWIPAPSATHSSGLIPLSGSFPRSFFTVSCTSGTRVEPPTRRT